MIVNKISKKHFSLKIAMAATVCLMSSIAVAGPRKASCRGDNQLDRPMQINSIMATGIGEISYSVTDSADVNGAFIGMCVIDSTVQPVSSQLRLSDLNAVCYGSGQVTQKMDYYGTTMMIGPERKLQLSSTLTGLVSGHDYTFVFWNGDFCYNSTSVLPLVVVRAQ